MNWTNVSLIFLREVRDQLRDRRTLFTIAVLPLLLYPLLGMAFLQVSQFTHEQPAEVWIVGASQLPAAPPLIDGQRFDHNVCSPEESRLLELQVDQELPGDAATEAFTARTRELIVTGKYPAVVVFPAGFAEAVARFRSATGAAACPSRRSFLSHTSSLMPPAIVRGSRVPAWVAYFTHGGNRWCDSTWLIIGFRRTSPAHSRFVKSTCRRS